MNAIQNDPFKASFKLKMEEIDNPYVLLDAFQQLQYEVWRYERSPI